MTKKLAPFVFVAALFLFPAASQAATLGDLQAQIAALLAQVLVLQNQLKASSAGTVVAVPPIKSAPSCVTLTHTLFVDDTDSITAGDVTKLQQFLASQGTATYPEARVTGYFGPATQRALQRWQYAHAVTSAESGMVGSATRSALNCTMTTTTPTITTTTSPAPTIGPISLPKTSIPIILVPGPVTPSTPVTVVPPVVLPPVPAPSTPVLPAYAKSSYTYSGLVGMFNGRSGSSYTADNQLISMWAWSSSGNAATVRYPNAADGYYEDFSRSGDWIILKGWGDKTSDGKSNLYYTIQTTKAVVTLNGTQYDLTSQFKGGPHPYALEAIPSSSYTLYVEGVLHESVNGVDDGRTLNFSWYVDWTKPGPINTVFLGPKTGIIQSEDFIEFRSPQVETRQVQAICDGYGYQCYMKLNNGLEGGLRP